MTVNNKIYRMKEAYLTQPWFGSDNRYELLSVNDNAMPPFGPDGVFREIYTGEERTVFLEIMRPLADEESREIRLKLLLEN